MTYFSFLQNLLNNFVILRHMSWEWLWQDLSIFGNQLKKYQSCASKIVLKILQARLQRTWTMKFQMFKLDLEKAEEPKIKEPTPVGSHKKQENARKTSSSAWLITTKTLTVWITINCGKFWKRWEYQTTWPASWETYMQVRKQQLEPDMEHGLVPNWERSMSRLHTVTLLI